ncbi:cytochrome P450 [Desarmillaria tabescens]|uniref:Cytochrome P450 n=1 Tax=Armillaria tabescens TaxID=1929756 RepID=A0AA39TNK5_ARMTA|nr:cytochrome P450 [Desarmillaria tabescens]KAK0461023.1 cytochrome P450 [Desarmillaria tabescens]
MSNYNLLAVLEADPVNVVGLGLLAFLAVLSLYRRFTRISVSHIPGPPPESFVLGNLAEIFQSQAGEPDFKWQRQYGDVVRVKGTFGEDRLLISDPKALQYIFHTSGYGFLKWPQRTEISRVLMGRGLLWADGNIHKRQRKVMLPGFGAPECKSFIPIFQRTGSELVAKWTDILAGSPSQSVEMNVATWLSRATMDSLGEAAFDYQFGALAQRDNELMKAYFGLMNDTLGSPSKKTIFLQTILPVWALQLRAKYSNSKPMAHARYTAKLAEELTQALIDMKSSELLQGKGSKDVLSLLGGSFSVTQYFVLRLYTYQVKANASEDVATALTHEEMLAQMRTLLLAGHETSATSTLWILLELARHPDVQDRLRNEIRAVEHAIHSRGDSEFTSKDFESMTYTIAVMKEAMRLHPALYHNYRRAAHDDVLPLSKPILTTSDELIDKLPVPKGMKVFASIAGYNRNKDLWGNDADVFNPERWLQPEKHRKGPSVGVYGNLLTFAGGVRTCVGWRFAIYEVQALLIAIINNFVLSPTEDLKRLRREACLVMIPTLEGEVEKGENLPLRVSAAPRD